MITTDGKFRFAGTTIRSKIPVTELNQTLQINSSPETIVSLLNDKERDYHSQLQKMKKGKGCKLLGSSPLIWRVCQTCKKIFLLWAAHLKRAGNHGMFCSISCRQKVAIYKYLLASGKHVHKMTEERKQIQREQMMGEKNRAWKGGVTYFKTHGNYVGVKYIRCPKEYLSMARKDGYVMEHRILVAKEIGRPLLRTEVIHHIDHNPANNNISNLILFTNNQVHKKHEHGDLTIKPLWQLSVENTTKV